MDSNKKGKSLTEQFLTELEEEALDVEEEMLSLIDINKQSRYLSDLLDVLNVSKVAFAEGYTCLSENKENEFLNILAEVLPSQEEVKKLLAETKNLYYLSTSNLIDCDETIHQQHQAEATIDSFINKLSDYLSVVDMNTNSQRISKSEKKIERMITIGDKFDDYQQTDEIADINFFGEVLENMDFSDSDKFDFICQVLTDNVSFYRTNKSKEAKVPEILFEEPITLTEEKETLDELLEVLLGVELLEEEPNFGK